MLTLLATVDVRHYGQFIALSVTCVRHDACEAARRVGPSATADTCDALVQESDDDEDDEDLLDDEDAPTNDEPPQHPEVS